MKDMKTNQIIITAIVAVIVGGAAFFGGMKYQQSKTLTGIRQLTGARGAQGGNQGIARVGGAAGMGIRPIVGQILSQDEKSITVKLQDGSSKIVVLPSTATYSKTATGAKSDLKVGDNVGVFGTTNPDGSVTAQTVQENPNFGMVRVTGATPSASPATKITE